MYRESLRVHGSGRTDAGVHALAQIVHFNAPRELKNLNLKAALNTLLSPDIRVIRTAIGSKDFHARFSARMRHYRYLISRREAALDRQRVWCLYHDLDVEAMRTCAAMIMGEHDFTAFCSAQAEADHKRCIVSRSEWEKEGDRLIYSVSANRFLHSMVRSLTGTMTEVGKGRLTTEDFAALLENRHPALTAFTAPPQGLYLVRVDYDIPIDWEKEKV
ncbi:MAG: tRNA pseudouridine(38-40) synthase TruA, partial [FCB group bacterium]|nr:tRNA pseudouridine(38-40) synthase TruA [FCB group bacterium]